VHLDAAEGQPSRDGTEIRTGDQRRASAPAAAAVASSRYSTQRPEDRAGCRGAIASSESRKRSASAHAGGPTAPIRAQRKPGERISVLSSSARTAASWERTLAQPGALSAGGLG
jgi:hypothetical protein